MDKIRLRTNLGKIKEMHVKMNIINISNRNENSMNYFLSSSFSPVMADSTAARIVGESASLTLDNKSLWKASFRASSEKNSCLLETVPLLNQCINKESYVRLETDI